MGWATFLLGFVGVFALFHVLASVFGSHRGEAGAVVASCVLAAVWLIAVLAAGDTPKTALARLGIGRPAPPGLVAVAVIVAALLAVVSVSLGPSWTLYPNATVLAVGIFLQAGLAEESLFRAYLFGRLRPGRTFWQAAWLAAGPFVAAHLFLFFTLPLPLAAASVGLSVVTTFPFARLYELGGRTVWAPAILHAVVQGVPKLVVPAVEGVTFPLLWMAACAILPFAVFLPVFGGTNVGNGIGESLRG